TAIDDFGAGWSSLDLLADFQPDCVKVDRALISDIGDDRAKQAIVRGVVGVCRELGIVPLAEGVETAAEFDWLRGAGFDLFQGFLFARPAFRALPPVDVAFFGA
ncbi:MAG: EAL domain-containing protein, partial [Planctomycetes bacterium]|nr:EAL domain-containing protein [Planctomycetota bacterium]